VRRGSALPFTLHKTLRAQMHFGDSDGGAEPRLTSGGKACGSLCFLHLVSCVVTLKLGAETK